MLMRKSYTGLLCLSLTLTSSVAAQILTNPNSVEGRTNTEPASTTGKTKIRSIAVVEYAGDKPESGKFRVVPVSIYENGRYRNGQTYLATPVPLSLQEGAIYEIQQSGKTLGYATIARTGTIGLEDGRIWYGIAPLQQTAPDAEIAKAPNKIVLNDSEEHHVYMPEDKKKKGKRGRDQDKDNSKGGQQPSSKPNSTSSGGSTTDSSKTSDGSGDPDRPTLKKRPPEQPQQSSAGIQEMPSAAVDADPDRPKLARGKPVSTATAIPEKIDFSGSDLHALAAVSDPTNKEAHTYRFDFNEKEERTNHDKMLALAMSEAKRTRPDLPLPPSSQWKDVNIRAFNLSLDNVATLVLTATAPADTSTEPTLKRGRVTQTHAPTKPRMAGDQYITVVARVDLNGDLRRTFFQITDRDRLDIAPQMTLVDAVDADGDGRGELLFRLRSDAGPGWGIYRATPDDLRKLFDTLPAQD